MRNQLKPNEAAAWSWREIGCNVSLSLSVLCLACGSVAAGAKSISKWLMAAAMVIIELRKSAKISLLFKAGGNLEKR